MQAWKNSRVPPIWAAELTRKAREGICSSQMRAPSPAIRHRSHTPQLSGKGRDERDREPANWKNVVIIVCLEKGETTFFNQSVEIFLYLLSGRVRSDWNDDQGVCELCWRERECCYYIQM